MMDYAQLTNWHESIGMPPFKLLHGFQPWTSFDWRPSKDPATAKECLSQEEAQALAKSMHHTWETAKTIMRGPKKKRSEM